MIHLILGKGNLGTALAEYCSKIGVPRGTFKRHHFRNLISEANLYNTSAPVVVWNTEGFGSVDECKKNTMEAFHVHFTRNLELMCKLNPNILLVNFSTNYVTDKVIGDPKSEYTSSKACMEALTKTFPREKIVTIKVANLYSKYFPMRAFQGKILKNKDKITSLPFNTMNPTDCDWLVKKIFENLIDSGPEKCFGRVIGISTMGQVSAKKFGEIVLGKELEEVVDKTRPLSPPDINTWDLEWMDDNWETVWENAKPEFMAAYNKENLDV